LDVSLAHYQADSQRLGLEPGPVRVWLCDSRVPRKRRLWRCGGLAGLATDSAYATRGCPYLPISRTSTTLAWTWSSGRPGSLQAYEVHRAIRTPDVVEYEDGAVVELYCSPAFKRREW